MRFIWSIHLYPPKHNCGSEWMAHNINRYLISKGHEVRVILHQAKINKINVPYVFDGVEVYGPTGELDQYRWADVILTHLEYTELSIHVGRLIKRPVIHFVHNDHRYRSVENAKKVNVVYNSQWIADKLDYNWPSFVFTPFCDYDYINVNKHPGHNEYITIVNMNENKGGEIFWKIASAMPGKQFLGVQGSYDEQIIGNLPNVTLVPNTKDIREYYKKTRLIIMPSKYESWGMVATEAMCNGIPVICTPTPGLTENCGSVGCYVADRNDISKWVEWINKFDNKDFYNEMSSQVRERAKLICDKNKLQQLENFLYESLQNYRSI